MARRMIAKVRKPKTTTRTEQYVINKKYLGDEPTFTKPLTKIDYINALNWYSYMCDVGDAKEYISEYLTNLGRINDAKRIKSIPDLWIPTTVAWICRLLTKGFKLPTECSGYIGERIGVILNYSVEEKEEDDTPKVSVQDRMREKARDIIGEVEGLIDDYLENSESFSFYNWLSENSIPPIYVSRIIDKLTPVLDELLEAYEGKDEQLKEGYRRFKKTDLKKIISFYEGMIEDANKYSGVAKKTRKPRKRKTISMEKKLKTFKWQREDSTYKIASVAPEKIIGASELWTFNTKYKTLTVLRSLDRAGLQVKGTSITNYDEKTSISRSTGRKTEEILKRAVEGGKIVLRKLMDEIKTEKPLAYRTNENTILLRIIQ